ncbi:MAG: DUF2461 domain-containing protein [Vicinamibacterales bacterium]
MFSNKTLAFLRALARNNDRAWFHAHRDQYERDVRTPVAAIVERLAADFPAFAPDMMADPKVSLFRPWRDTRFSEDKSPLKTNVAAVFPHRRLGRMNGAAFYFEVTPKWVWIGGGAYAPDAGQLHAIRKHIAANLPRVERILSTPAMKRLGGLQGDTISRVPRGWPKDHPAADYLVHKQFLGFREEPAAFAARPDFYRQLVSTLKALAPLVAFLNEPLVDRLRFDQRAHILDE